MHIEQETEKFLTNVTKNLKFPCVLKPHDDGCSVFVQKADDLSDLIKKLVSCGSVFVRTTQNFESRKMDL